MIPSLDQIDAKRIQSDPSISVGDIHVAGNVQGSIVVGNRNVIGDNNVVYEVHDYHGAVINWHAAPPVSPRDIKPLAPRAPFEFVGRESEQKTLEAQIQNRRASLLYSQDGIGKTTLLKQVANSPAAKAMPDGVFYAEQLYQGNQWSLQDILQRLFDKLFTSNPPLKVTDAVAELHLQHTRPLIILDQMGFSPADLNRLPDLFPDGAVLVSALTAPFDDTFESIQLLPLNHEDAIQLFAQKAHLALDEFTHPVIDQICQLLEDIPLAIIIIANAIPLKRLSLSAITDDLRAIRPPSQNKVQAAIERSFGLLYPRLNKQERDMLAMTAAAPGDSVDRAWLESLAGGTDVSTTLQSLELLYTHSPRLGLPEGLRPVLQSGRGDLGALRGLLLRHLLEELQSRSQDFDFMIEEFGNILGLLQWAYSEQRWSDVIALGRAIDPFLTLFGMWDAWGTVLNQVLTAGQQLQNPAVQSWAFHQLGTREVGAGTRNQAIRLLLRALRMRISQGDLTGAAYTLHNLKLLLPPTGKKEGPTPPPDEPTLWEKIVETFRERGWSVPGTLIGVAILAAIAGVLLRPSLTVRAEAAPAGYNPVGQVIEYDYVVDNPGLLRLAGPVTVTDDKIRVRCADLQSIGNQDEFLDWNEILNCTGFYTIAEADIVTGSVTNIAQALAVNKKENVIRSRPETVTIRFEPQYLDLKIEADRKTYHDANETIAYTYTARNIGSTTLQGALAITSNHNLQAACPENSDYLIDVGETFTCTATYTVTEEDVKNGSVTNTVSVKVGDFRSGQQSLTTFYNGGGPGGTQITVLRLSKSADPQIYTAPGQEIKYNYSVTLEGTEYLAGPITVSDDVVKVSCPDLKEVGNKDNQLDPSETINCEARYTITDADIDRRYVTNTARASAGDRNSAPQSITIYYETTPPVLRKSAKPESFEKVGQPIEYTYSVMNNGKAPLPGPVFISDDKLKVTCPDLKQVGNQDEALDPGEPFTCTATYTITEEDMLNGSVTNTAWATVGRVISQSDSVTIYTPVAPSRLSLTKTADPATYQKEGDLIKYTYYVQNAGRLPLKGPVLVEDDQVQVNCPNLETVGDHDQVFDAGEFFRCDATYTISQADIERGTVTNVASASADGVTSNPDSATVNAKALILSMSAPESYQAAKEQIQYKYSVTSHSRQPLNGPVSVADDKVQVTCKDLDTVGNLDNFLDWSETVLCEGQYIVTQDDIDRIQTDTGRGAITNTARAHAGDLVSEPVTWTVQGPLPQPKIALGDTAASNAADPKIYDAVDQNITYTYVITNSGNVTLSMPWTITDDHVQNNAPINCVTNLQRLAPTESFTCDNTGTYTIVQTDFNFGNSSVTSKASVSGNFLQTPVISDTVTTTVTCQYPGQPWFAYTVEDRETFSHILTWYPNSTMADVQKANCMGSSTDIGVGQTLYVPSAPPTASITGVIRDSAGRRLSGITITLYRGSTAVRSQTTGGNGTYSFSGLGPGTYRIFETEVILKRGITETQDFEVRPVAATP